VVPANITWTGAGTTNNFSDPANWGGKVPGAADTAIFNNTSTKAATVDAGFAGTVAAVQIDSGYTGTITLKESLTDTGSYSQNAGTLKTNGFTLSVGSDVNITGGTFSNTTGTLNLNGSSSDLNAPTAALGNVAVNTTGTISTISTNLDVGSLTLNSGTLVAPLGNLTVAANLVDNGGTFNANGGTLVFAANVGAHTVNVSGSSGATVSLHNLSLADSGLGTRTYRLTGTLDVSGNFSERPASPSTSVVVNGGTIAVRGNVSVGAGAKGGTTDLQFEGATSQSYSSSGGILPAVEIANASDTVSAAAGTTNLGVQNLMLTSGSFVAPVGTLTIVGNLAQTAGAFNPNGGTVIFSTTRGNHAININGQAAGLLTLNKLTFADGGTRTHTYSFGEGDGFYLTGSFTAQVQSGSTATMLVNGGIFDVANSIMLGAGYKAGTPAPQFNIVNGADGLVSGAVYVDVNGAGQEQPNAPGLAGWTVDLLSGGQVIASTQTNSAGGYALTNVTPGSYTVQEVVQGGWTATTSSSVTVPVTASTNSAVNFGAFQDVVISGQVFNGMGAQPGLAGWTRSSTRRPSPKTRMARTARGTRVCSGSRSARVSARPRPPRS
jgi:hypothetical protein